MSSRKTNSSGQCPGNEGRDTTDRTVGLQGSGTSGVGRQGWPLTGPLTGGVRGAYSRPRAQHTRGSRSVLSLISPPAQIPPGTSGCPRGLSLPSLPSQFGNTHTRDVSVALGGQLCKPGPMHSSNNWEWAVAPAFPSRVHFTPTIQHPSFLVEGKPWTYCQWARF